MKGFDIVSEGVQMVTVYKEANRFVPDSTDITLMKGNIINLCTTSLEMI